MNFADSCMVLAALFEAVCICNQIKHNKIKKSIYGLSYDYILLNWIATLASIGSSLNYYTNPEVIRQYRWRYPVHAEIPVIATLIIAETIVLVVSSALMFQTFFIYPKTRNINQCVSGLNMFFLGILGAGFVYVAKLYAFQESSMVLLDLVDYIWFIAKVTSLVKYWPQLMMNWFGQCVIGLHRNWFLLQSVGLFFFAVGKITSDWFYDWYQVPLNYNTWAYLFASGGSLILFLVQSEYWYHGNRPTLELFYYYEHGVDESVLSHSYEEVESDASVDELV
ncbi:uncharacterized protein RJT20DRAFT_32122 [Scheffersomyces xylosifermentans]|uniref:uncharacterized protein n=1 Tax=Scheffersomyces xylosifermentans TaxID=1304137 RepID=UPI00315DEC65